MHKGNNSDADVKLLFRKRLAHFTSEENIEASLKLGDQIAADSRPDGDLGARLTLVIAPFLGGDDDLEDMQYLAAFATNAWNTTLLPIEDEAAFTELMITTMTDNGDPDCFAREMTASMCAVKRLLFPDDMRFVGNCDVRREGNKFTIIASAGPSYMNGPADRGRRRAPG